MGDDEEREEREERKVPRQDRKVFVGGLGLNTDTSALGEYFRQFGDLDECHVMRDGSTDESRGFGFVVFSDLSDMEECLKEKTHVVDGKEIDAKKAVPKEELWSKKIDVKKAVPKEDQRTKKVFLGGLDPETTEDDIKEAFCDTGLIDVKIMTEKDTEKPRGFAFAFFSEYEDVENVCAIRHFTVKDREVEVKKAIPKDELRRSKNAGTRNGEGSPPHQSPYDYYRGYPPMDYRMAYDFYHRYPGDYYPDRFSMYPSYGRYPPPSYGYGSAYDMYPPHYPPLPGGSSYSSGGSYSQSSSSYGPTRSSYADKDRSSARSYHPYTRR